MKKRFFTIFLIMVISIFFANADDSDTAIIELRGNVPARVDVTVGESFLDLGEIGETESSLNTQVVTRANVPFSLTIESVNDGKLVWDEEGEPADNLRTDYDYTLNFGGTDITLDGETTLIDNGSRGRQTTTIEITTDSLDSILSDTESEIPTEGNYEDELTLTIKSEN